MYLYQYKNKISGRIYYGITSNIKARQNSHRHLAKYKKTPFYNAVRKYGWDNFEFAIIAEDIADIIKNLEINYIEKDKNCYNLHKKRLSLTNLVNNCKPSGTVSQLVDSASGIHPRHNDYYIRTVRADVKDPLAAFLKDKGVPCEQDYINPSNLVFSFPMKAPEGSITRNSRTALQQLEHYLKFKTYWCEHNPSITVYVKEHEWPEVGAWVFNNMDSIGGVSFLPHNEHSYQQAPYQDIDKETYEKALAEFPKIVWAEFDSYEVDDATVSMHELACVSGACELI